ncbi:hypothetical protein [Hymenobacter glacialis]|uniref:hypothetical protein n=1 Tax=Hymenobacter glacialis TaxID=1908236 RepID=UPI0009F6332C|nr:hypothetical protein [Hymenobacter glacialis]
MLVLPFGAARAQAVPNAGERVETLVTFGAQSDKSWGDDDFSQTFFFLIPEKQREPVYIRVWDPGCGGTNDDLKGPANTTTSFSLYGGPGTFSGPQARDPRPTNPNPTGRLLKSQTFGNEAKYDGTWFTFGPLNPLEAEPVDEFQGRVFKMVARGLSGNDGNLYRYFFSTSPTANVAVEGGNAFTYEYCFRLPATSSKTTVHLYPFVNNKVVSIKQSNFDADNGATLEIFSVAKNGHAAAVSGNGEWTSSVLPIAAKEHGLSLDFRLTSTSAAPNDLVFYVTDQYDTALPFFAIPLGGPPRYQYDIGVKLHR